MSFSWDNSLPLSAVVIWTHTVCWLWVSNFLNFFWCQKKQKLFFFNKKKQKLILALKLLLRFTKVASRKMMRERHTKHWTSINGIHGNYLSSTRSPSWLSDHKDVQNLKT
jgi:hypothetical protein